MSESIRVLHVIASLATVDGGPVEAALRLHEELPSFGVVSTIVTTDRRMNAADAGRSMTGVDVVRARPPKRYNFAPGMGRQLRSRLPADVVHVHAVDTYTSTIGARFAARRRVPLVLQPHGAYDAYHRDQNTQLKSIYLNVVDRRNFERAAAVVASSPREAEGIATVLGRTAEVIPLGVDPWLFDLPGRRSKPGRILFLGRLTAKKSVDVAIRAFAASGLAERGVSLDVAGPLDPRLPYDPKMVAKESGVSDAVHFLGGVDRARRADLLSRADVFVLPSLDESFGVSVAEAMAAGCAVLTTPEVGMAVEAAEAGALVLTDRSPGVMADALRRLFDRPARIPELSSKGRGYASKQFEWSSVARRFADLYVSATR